MRANEFISETQIGTATTSLPDTDREVKIVVPVTIQMPQDDAGTINITGKRKINATIAAPANTKDMPSSPIFVSPLQQELEMMKQQGGKVSPVINQIIADTGPDSDPNDGPFEQFDDKTPEPKASIYYGIDEINGAR
jgi:hypothetical protein